ncbi:hypothetical protein GGR43_003021 [Sphingobium jiangsuense]|uniref:Uncharacterized protein n=1 Tax=Sphingobium jiangsuense TaxID=870476 RepID=A0A7W6BPB6_9SPHN|nr:hypothetical protein [Sphingobium jiangsuense]
MKLASLLQPATATQDRQAWPSGSEASHQNQNLKIVPI